MANIYEQEMQDDFERKLGRRKADELQRIWNNSYPKATSNIFVTKSKQQVFEETAKSQGFKKKEIDMFLKL